MTQSTRRGFTLIELIVVVAIAAILAAIAIPSYTNYVVRSNRRAAQSTMLDIAQKEQQYLLDARSYAADLSGLKYTVPSSVSSLYNVTATPIAGPPPGFMIKAAPIAGTPQANDPTLTLDNTGLKTPAAVW